MSSAEEHFRGVAEDRALLRLTTARPAELASAIGPDLHPGYSAGLVAADDVADAFRVDAGAPELELAVAIAAEFRAPSGLGISADRLPSAVVERAPAHHDSEGPASSRGGARTAESDGRTPRLVAVPDLHPEPPAVAVPVDAALWLEIGALIPEVARRRRQPGRRRRDDRAVLEGILHVLATGIGWRELPQDLGCGSGVTCWRRLREWVDGGTWAVVEPPLRAALGPACGVDWDRPWAGTGRSPVGTGATRPTPSGADPTGVTQDPGATPRAVARRLSWAGPSRV